MLTGVRIALLNKMLSPKYCASNCENRISLFNKLYKNNAEVKLFYRPGSYQFSLVLFEFPYCILKFFFSISFPCYFHLYNLIPTERRVYFLYWHLLCFEEMTKKKVIANQYPLVNLKLS